MTLSFETLLSDLKAARQRKGLSQRALSERAGIPQSHISKIENGAVDISVSSLVALARALDLEVTLVPRQNLPAIDTLLEQATRMAANTAAKLHAFNTAPSKRRPAYSFLDDGDDDDRL